jgi:hypothetical protein
MARFNKERKLVNALDYRGLDHNGLEKRHFYEHVFKIKNVIQFHKRINDIMYDAYNYDDFYISAAADFARKMIEPNRQTTKIDFQLFCNFFEFAYTEFIPIIRRPQNYQDMIDPNNDRAINDNKFINLENRYNQFTIEVNIAGLVNQPPMIVQPRNDNTIFGIQNMAIDYVNGIGNGIRFRTESSAVYHWRKHFENLNAHDYLMSANRTIAEGIYLPNTKFHFLNLEGDINNERVYDFAIVSEKNPIELISFYKIKVQL